MLHLAAPTRDDWLDAALDQLDVVLLDHAHCEKKAASTAMNLIFRYIEQPWLMRPLSALAREELDHFEQVLDRLAARGVPFRRIEPSAYAGRLCAAIRKPEPYRLLDQLLCCALIEARSCERMQLLAEGLECRGESELAAFYASLLASEARHFSTYVDLARQTFGRGGWTTDASRPPAQISEADIRDRLAELAAHEAQVLAVVDGPMRLHA